MAPRAVDRAIASGSRTAVLEQDADIGIVEPKIANAGDRQIMAQRAGEQRPVDAACRGARAGSNTGNVG